MLLQTEWNVSTASYAGSEFCSTIVGQARSVQAVQAMRKKNEDPLLTEQRC